MEHCYAHARMLHSTYAHARAVYRGVCVDPLFLSRKGGPKHSGNVFWHNFLAKNLCIGGPKFGQKRSN